MRTLFHEGKERDDRNTHAASRAAQTATEAPLWSPIRPQPASVPRYRSRALVEIGGRRAIRSSAKRLSLRTNASC